MSLDQRETTEVAISQTNGRLVVVQREVRQAKKTVGAFWKAVGEGLLRVVRAFIRSKNDRYAYAFRGQRGRAAFSVGPSFE